MSTTGVLQALEDPRLELAPQNFVTFRERRPELDDLPAAELLARSDHEPGNLRFAPSGHGVERVSELRVGSWSASVVDGAHRLLQVAQLSDASGEMPDEELVVDSLADVGLPWTAREAGWGVQVPAIDSCEVHVERQPGGAVCRLTLAQWDQPLEPDSRGQCPHTGRH